MPARLLAALDSPFTRRTLLGGVIITVLLFAVLAAHWRPLWYDELFTLYVASEPTLGDVLRALLKGADTNPPVDYLLRHASLASFGDSSAAFRWPSAAAFVAGQLAIFAYVRTRVPFLAAAGAALLPVATAAVFFTYEGRAYALLFASAPIALWAWQRAAERSGRPLRLVLLLGALCFGPYSHYYGVLNFLPVTAGEALRWRHQHRIDWPMAAVIAAAAVLTLGLLVFARNASGMQGNFWAAGFRFAELPGYYSGFLGYAGAAAYIVVGVAVALAALGWRGSSPAERPAVPAHEILAAAVLALTPVSAFLLAVVATGALTSKYTIALVAGVAILVGYLLACGEARHRGLVAATTVLLAIWAVGRHASSALDYRGSEPIPAAIRAALVRSSQPVAFDSPHLFLQFVHYEPQLAGRFVYPMDAATALEVRGFNNDEIALRGLQQIRPLNVVGYRDFIDRHDTFLVVYSRVFWPALVKALRRDGYCLAKVTESGSTELLQAFPGCASAAR
jgi:hypothetical protein